MTTGNAVPGMVKGRQINLSGDRNVWVGFQAPSTVVVRFTRPGDDGKPYETAVAMSIEAFAALITMGVKMFESGEFATSELALAVPKDEKSPCPEP